MIKTKNDFSNQFHKDQIVIKISSLSQLRVELKLLSNKTKIVKKIRNKIWKKKNNNYINYSPKIFK